MAVWVICFSAIGGITCTAGDDYPQCEPGQEQRCGSNVGICRAGWQQCNEQGVWDSCLGAIDPAEEVCDGQDNDCNGKIDELNRECSNDCGQKGTEQCLFGEWICDVSTPIEECGDELDNDCDGSQDEGCNCQYGLEMVCGTDVGECISGLQKCQDAYWTECIGAVGPVPEICDGLDNDCDGAIDEDLTSTCDNYCGGTGVNSCQNGGWVCDAPECPDIETKCPDPKPEVCDDDIDNDCDGWTDSQWCDDGCKSGVQYCENGQWGECSTEGPTTEVCNCIDDDCDKQTDEDLGETDCSTACGEGKKRCINCHMICDAPQPEPEECDNEDNDCNQRIDDGLVQSCTVDCPGDSGDKREGTQRCEKGVWLDCAPEMPCPQ